MVDVEYTPGTSVALVGARTWLLLAVPADTTLVGRCWDLVRDDVEFDVVLSAIFHEGFRVVGSFALVRYCDAEKRAVLRGGVRLHVVGRDGAEHQVDPEGVPTWIDHGLDEIAEFRLTAGEVAAGPVLPLRAGVVLASSLRVGLTAPLATAQPFSEPVRTPVVEPEPEPVPFAEPARETIPFEEPPVVVPEPDGYDHLFEPGPRVVAPVESDVFTGTLGPRQVPVPPREPPLPTPDHEGVIMDLPWASPAPVQAPSVRHAAPPQEEFTDTVLRARQVSPDDTRQVAEHSGVPKVRAVNCENGHLNPEHGVRCRLCDAPVHPQQPYVVPRPSLGVLRLSTGDVITLDRGVVLGRNPQAGERGPTGPHVVKLATQGGDISRNHVEVRLQDWDVLVVDLGSKNGTTMAVPGWSPQALAAHIPAILPPGALVVLGDDTSFTYEVVE